MSKIGKSTENTSPETRKSGIEEFRRNVGKCLWFGVYFRGDEILLNLLWCRLHNCEYMKNYLIVSFKGVNSMVCKLYINKNIKKKEK